MMKNYVQFVVLTFLVILLPIRVDALCDYNEKARLKSIASNVAFSKYYVENKTDVEFFITLTNLHPEIYVMDITNYGRYDYNFSASNPKEITIGQNFPGMTIKYEFYGKSGDCKDELLLIRYVTLPSYNPFYKDPLCEGMEEYDICQKWVRVNLNYESFKKTIEKYKQSDDEKPSEETPDEQPVNLDVIASFLLNYYVYILSGIILVCLILIYRLRKKDSFDF